MAVWTDAGVDVAYCIVTDGDAGGSDLALPRDEMAKIRREEQLAAAGEVGVTDVTFLGFPDGRLVSDLELRQAITGSSAGSVPTGWSPSRRSATGRASTRATPTTWPPARPRSAPSTPMRATPLRSPSFSHEGLEPHVVPEMWIMATERADRVVDATAASTASWLPCAATGARSARATTSTSSSGAGCGAPPSQPACRRALAEAFHVVNTT